MPPKHNSKSLAFRNDRAVSIGSTEIPDMKALKPFFDT